MVVITFLDYDNTILCSYYLQKQGFKFSTLSDNKNVEKIQQELSALSDKLIDMIKIIKKHSKLFIVTNAETGWAEYTLEKLLPNVFKEIDGIVDIVSARTKYEPEFPDNPVMWKKSVMMDIISDVENEAFCTIVEEADEYLDDQEFLRLISKSTVMSIGDSLDERLALLECGKKRPDLLLKSLKLIDNPTCIQLTSEIDAISSSLAEIYASQNTVDLQLNILTDF